MSYRLTITLFAPETQSDHGVMLGLPHALLFPDQSHLCRFADHTDLLPEIMRLLERHFLDTVMIPLTRFTWGYTPNPDDPERDLITKSNRTYGTAIREFGLTRDCGLALRTLARLSPIASPNAILHLARFD